MKTMFRIGEIAVAFVVGGAVALWLRTDTAPPAGVVTPAPEIVRTVEPVTVAARSALPRTVTEPALHGADVARAVAPSTAPGPVESLPRWVRADPRVLELYVGCTRAVAAARERQAAHAKADPDGSTPSDRAVERLQAIIELIEQNRFFYMGPSASRPKYTQSDSVRYTSTQIGDLLMVFEFTRAEFPAVFDGPNLRDVVAERTAQVRAVTPR